MKIGLMQPYFFPYVGYFQLIAAVDCFIIYDDVQFIKNGWINRNRILLNNSASWVTLPVGRGHLHDHINQRHFVDYKPACGKILSQLDSAYRKAPFFRETSDFVESLLAREGDNVAATLSCQLEMVARHLSLSAKFLDSSGLTKDDAALAGQDRVIEICRAMKASEYYNAIGGIPLYNPEAFEQHGITLRFLQPRQLTYKQYDNEFVPHLSLIDVLMFNPLDEVIRMVREYDLVTGAAGVLVDDK